MSCASAATVRWGGFDLTETAVREAERLVAAVARGVTMAGGAIRAAKARMNFTQSADPGEQLG